MPESMVLFSATLLGAFIGIWTLILIHGHGRMHDAEPDPLLVYSRRHREIRETIPTREELIILDSIYRQGHEAMAGPPAGLFVPGIAALGFGSLWLGAAVTLAYVQDNLAPLYLLQVTMVPLCITLIGLSVVVWQASVQGRNRRSLEAMYSALAAERERLRGFVE